VGIKRVWVGNLCQCKSSLAVTSLVKERLFTKPTADCDVKSSGDDGRFGFESIEDRPREVGLIVIAFLLCVRHSTDAKIVKKSGSQNLHFRRITFTEGPQPVNDILTSHLFLIKRRCKYCNCVFTPASHNQTYCSYACRANAKLEKGKPPDQEIEQCSYCDCPFMPASHNQKYCSRACRTNATIQKRKTTASKENRVFETQIQPHPNPSDN